MAIGLCVRWSAEQLAEAGPEGFDILPDLCGQEILAEDDMDEDNHSLESFDRSPRLERMQGA